MKNSRRTKVKKGLTPAIMLVVMVLTSSCLFAQSGKLLYKGKYTLRLSQSRELNSGYFVGDGQLDQTETISIYEDQLKINFSTCKYETTNDKGERVYKGGSISTVTVYVSPSYEIRYYDESFFNGRGMRVTFPVVKGQSLMPENSGDYNGGKSSGYQSSGNNNESSGTSNGSKHGSYVKEETCPACHGTKTCETCLGRGWRNNPYTNQHDTCPICHGKKTCQSCNGTGKKSKTVY